MLAFLRTWDGPGPDGKRMATSLALPAPDHMSFAQHRDACFAQFHGIWGKPAAPARGSIPAEMPSGDKVLFAGWFDNLDEIAGQLSLETRDPALVYGHAVDRWGDKTELHLIGAYAAVIDRPRLGEVRLARSPITAPPLHVHRSREFVAAASVPRALLALGISDELDETRIAMHLHAMPHDSPGGWYRAIESLQLGTVLTATRDGASYCRPHDLARLPEARMGSDQECLETVEALLDEAIDRTIAGYRQPGTFLSGGLDSSIVASHTIDRMPASRRLPCFTFCPEPGAHGEVPPHLFGDELGYVEEFAAMHPRIETHFIDNAGRSFADGQQSLFLLAGMSPTPLGVLYPYHGMFAAARQRGCDLMIGAGMGNTTFSNAGGRGHVEYFRKGWWRQAWRAAANRHADPRPVWRRFLSLSVLRSLPNPLWQLAMAARNAGQAPPRAVASALNPAWPGRDDLTRAAEQADASFARPFYRSREDEIASMARQMDADACDLMQAFSQQHLIAFRDVTRYRPLVEFCWSLPTRHFLWDGVDRRLARSMGRGRLPEAMRTERRRGLQHADWHLRLGRQRPALLAELRTMRENSQIARLVDLDRLIGLLENFPDSPTYDRDATFDYVLALPNGIAMGRFIRFVTGANAT